METTLLLVISFAVKLFSRNNLYTVIPVYSGHLVIADTFFAARKNPYIFHIIIPLYSGHLYSGYLLIADTFLEVFFANCTSTQRTLRKFLAHDIRLFEINRVTAKTQFLGYRDKMSRE